MAENNNEFIAYEYRDITVKGDMKSLYVDNYPHFGWQLEKQESAKIATILTFKQNLEIPCRQELINLQHQFDKNIREIIDLEQSKSTGAKRVACIIGIIGTFIIVLSIFNMLTDNFFLCIGFTVLGVIAWILPYLVYKRLTNYRSKKVMLLINKRYDTIREICSRSTCYVEI